MPAGCPAILAGVHPSSPASPCVRDESLHAVLTKISQHFITVLPLSSVIPLQHLNATHCISIALCYYCRAGCSALFLVESVFL